MFELELLEKIRAIFSATDPSLIVGNGDDGAVYSPKNNQVVSADVAVEGVHFRCDWSEYREIGLKVTAGNLADIYAMGGIPKFLMVTLVLPGRHLDGALDIAQGILQEAKKVGAIVIGGDISTGEELSISITAIGEVKKPILRSGAKVGDRIQVSSLPGASAAGLAILQEKQGPNSELERSVVLAHKAPEIEYRKFEGVMDICNSAIDISDGLLIDCSRIASASGVKMELNLEKISKSELKEIDSDRYLEWVLTGGEDHKLLVTSNRQIPGFIEIGKVVEGSGVYLDGAEVKPSGYLHHWDG
jgi:thiamine-monophosphate kinase